MVTVAPSDRNHATQSPHASLNNRSTQASPNLSRRTSGAMGPPPVPHNGSLPTSPRLPINAANDTQSLGGTTGPIRHPRPLTAAELHLELEKEQESIVNRLTRELSALRAQTASVASTASSTSDLYTSNPLESHLYPYQYDIVPLSARRHRSSSNLSSRSARSARDALTNAATATSVSGVAAPRDRDRDSAIAHSLQPSSRPSVDVLRPVVSRQNSQSGITMHRTPSNAAYPFISSTNTAQQSQIPHSASSRHSISSNYSAYAGEHLRSPSLNTANAAARYEEAALHRAELESVKKENESLKQKIRELERKLSGKRESGGVAVAVEETGSTVAATGPSTSTNATS